MSGPGGRDSREGLRAVLEDCPPERYADFQAELAAALAAAARTGDPAVLQDVRDRWRAICAHPATR